MKKTPIIFFYAHEKDKTLGHQLETAAGLIFRSLQEPCKKEKSKSKHALIIICDSTEDGQGIHKLKEIRHKLPHATLFLLAQNPSREYLMAALDCKVADFFPLPANNTRLIAAVQKHLVATQEATSLLKVVGAGWLQLKTFIHKVVSSTQEQQYELKNPEVLSIAPHAFLPLLGKEKDLEAVHDLSVQFFGKLQIKIRGKVVPAIPGKKNSIVLAYLLFHHHKSVHRDILIDKFWSDFNTSSAKNSLNVAICGIRKSLAKVLKDQEVILYENESYCINPQLEIITDVEKFTYFWKKGRAIEAAQGLDNALHAYNKAAALYQEEFLGNLRVDDWCESERANLREIYLFILNRLSAYFFDQKNYYACINICEKMLATDECLEEVHRKLMQCYYALGITDMAFKQFFKCKKILEEELDLQPSRPTMELFESIQNGVGIL